MIFPGQTVRIVIATKPVDFHKGYDGLAAMAITLPRQSASTRKYRLYDHFLPFLIALHFRFGKDFVSISGHLVFRKNGEGKMSTLEDMRILRFAAYCCTKCGISPKCLTALLEHSDGEIAVGDGTTALSVSQKQAAALDLPGKPGRYAGIVSEDSILIAVAPMHDGKRGGHWRRGLKNARGRG